MAESNEPSKKITVVKDGPYVVSGSVPLVKEDIVSEGGISTGYEMKGVYPEKKTYTLCRCGQTETPP
ncbi:MAG TPA: CDGSH iron-sulfur domain-containing protein, partial [Methanomassiliicoccaceae archaeon]|nr:CDGSH iron-sulfur domain-containing protein [Methanomassiliicoccaceae archaeon]